MKASDGPIIVTQTFNKPIDLVWNSITKIDLMKQWFFDNIPEFEPSVGFETRFTVNSEERAFIHVWKIKEVIPHKLISYFWKYENFPGDSYVEFELSDINGITQLKLTVVIIKDFPDDIPEFKRESCVGGWNYFLKERLQNFIEAF